MSGREEMERRRRRVKRRLAQGKGATEIARDLDVSRSTVYRDIDAIGDEIDDLKDGDIDEFLRVLKANFESVNAELWDIVDEPQSESNKIGALKQIVQTNKEMIGVLQHLGVLDMVAEEIKLSGGDGGAIEFIVEEYAETAAGNTAAASEAMGDDVDGDGGGDG